MIKITLKLPDAYETLSAIHVESAKAVDRAGELVAIDPAWSMVHAQRAARLQSIASQIQTAIILQLGVTEP